MNRFRRLGAPTPSAPHVRMVGDMRMMTETFLVALVPCLAQGVHNTGHQANTALASLGRTPPGWRGAVLGALGVGHEPLDVFACAVHGALVLAPLLGVALAVGAFWERLFARVRRLPRRSGLALHATLFTMALPPTLPLAHAALGMSFGVVVGREIFGGMGRYVIHPVLVGLAFLALAFPDRMQGDLAWVAVDGASIPTSLGLAKAGGMQAIVDSGVTWAQSFLGHVPGPLGATSTLACLVGAAYLVALRMVSWRILVGVVAGAAVTATVLGVTSASTIPAATVPWPWQLTLGSLAFLVVFVATDPVVAAVTQPGRWIYGLMIGFLAVLIRVANPVQEDGAILAVMLAGVFAPLVDHAVIRAHVRARRRRPAARGEVS